MRIKDILSRTCVECDVPATSKKRALQHLSELIAKSDPNLTTATVFECLLARERLGSTGLGRGVALPHGRLAALTSVRGAFLRLQAPVDFDAIDGQAVDLIFGLLVPQEATEEHLQLLALLAETFSDEGIRDALQNADSSDQAFTTLVKETDNA